MKHELKTWPIYFQAVWRGDKTFEVRKNDRGLDHGDTLILREWDPYSQTYSGRAIEATVTYICKLPPPLNDHVGMQIEIVEKVSA
jgi:ASC-1-like (ASCH) protein